MAKKSGRNGLVKIGANTIARAINISIEESAETIDSTDLDSTGKEYEVGDTDWTGSMEVHWDKADTTGQGVLVIGAEVTLIFQPEGDVSGDLTRTGDVIVTGANMAGIARNEMVKMSYTFQGNGALTDSAVA